MGRDFLPSFLAGGAAGMCEITVTYPLEFLKVNSQLDTSSGSVFKRILSNCRKQGYIRTLYTGSPAWFLFSFPRSAIRFSSFEFANNKFKNKQSLSTQITCGAFAGLIESITCLTPQNNASVKLSQLKMSGTNTTFMKSMQICYQKVGIQGFFLPGLFATAMKNTINYSIRFTIFRTLKQHFEETIKVEEMKGEKVPFQYLLLSGTIAGGVSAIVTQPIDTLRTNQMALGVGKQRVSILETAKHLLKKENGNIFALYRGLAPRLARVMIEIGLLFSLYETFYDKFDAMV